jgi:DNA polymerase-3 subunit delta'
MSDLKPFNQTKLFGLDKYINELIKLENLDKLPNIILLSGQKGLGKSTLAYHFINYVLSKNEDYNYDQNRFIINPENRSFKTILNKSNTNLISIDINDDKKFIDIAQIRELISNLKKSSLNDKPRFVLIDNIEFLNINSVNSLLKVIEEPSHNVYFILINNNKRIIRTLLSRCINFKISLSHEESLKIAQSLIGTDLDESINKDLVNYYFTPGNIFHLINFAKKNSYDLKNFKLKDFLEVVINNGDFKKNSSIEYLIFDFVEFYFSKINASLNIHLKYQYFIKKINDTKKFNLDYESLFMEFKEKILNA